MVQARKKSPGGGGGKKKGGRGWLLILIGLGIGVAGVYLAQLVVEHNLHRTVASWFKREKPAEHAVKKEPEKPKSKFDFYTILPETDAHAPRKEPKTAKAEKPAEKPADKPADKLKGDDSIVYILQAGSFETPEKADELKAQLALQGLQAYIQKVSVEGKGERHRVLLGPYGNLEERDAVAQQLSKIGIKPLRMTGKKSAG
jgi:cell division protein FtsN